MTSSIQNYDYDFMNVFFSVTEGVCEVNLHNYKYQPMFTRIVKLREISLPVPDVSTTELNVNATANAYSILRYY